MGKFSIDNSTLGDTVTLQPSDQPITRQGQWKVKSLPYPKGAGPPVPKFFIPGNIGISILQPLWLELGNLAWTADAWWPCDGFQESDVPPPAKFFGTYRITTQ